MAHFDKHFTLKEAQALLPRFREIFAEIHALVNEARGGQPSQPPNRFPAPRTNGHHKEKLERRDEILNQINDLVTEITDQGVVIQDITRGLIDFPAFIHGEEVFLCYELTDGDSIQYYHHLTAGYAGRHPIPPDME